MSASNLPDLSNQRKALEGSNSLADLAARIRAEHEAVGHALKRGLEHAIAAGTLLSRRRSKSDTGNGSLGCNSIAKSPSAQRSVTWSWPGTLQPNPTTWRVTPPSEAEPDWDDLDSVGAWAARRLDRPFTRFDLPWGDDDIETDYDCVSTKLMHQAGLPWTAKWCFDVADMTENGRPALRLCPWDDLLKAAKALASIVNGERVLKFDGFANIRSMLGAIALIRCEVMWLLGGLLREIEDREHLSDEDYEREWEETHSHVMARLNEERTEFREAAE